MGYHRAGFEVVGVDINPQNNYPFEFYKSDALAYAVNHWEDFDVLHASPPCQRFSVSTANKTDHPDLLTPIRDIFIKTGKPYIIENVIGAPLVNPVILCGSHFGLSDGDLFLARHRGFESNLLMIQGKCTCLKLKTAQITGHLSSKDETAKGHRKPSFERAKKIMGIDWMSKKEIVQAIPPAYTEWLGKNLINMIGKIQESA